MARRVAFFVDLAALALAGLIASVPSVRGAEGSGTFVVISDLHFNPFDPPELATVIFLLLPIGLNQQVQNFPFDQKKKAYIQHNLRMVQQVCQHDDWTFSEIEKREAQIVAWAKNRWGDL